MWRRQIPGHARAYTWVLGIIAATVTYWATREWMRAAGSIVLVLGAFIGDQATHLRRENHTSVWLSWLERKLERYTRTFQLVGAVIFGLGVWMSLRGMPNIWHEVKSVGAGLYLAIICLVFGEVVWGVIFEPDREKAKRVNITFSTLAGGAFGTFYWFGAQ